MIITDQRSLFGGFEQAGNSVDKNSKKSTGTFDHWKLLSKCRLLQARSSHCNEKWWIIQYLMSDNVLLQEDEYVLLQQPIKP